MQPCAGGRSPPWMCIRARRSRRGPPRRRPPPGRPTGRAVPAAERTRVNAALRRRPFSALDVHSREAVQSRLAAEPLARGLLDVLAMSALLALVLGVAGLVLVCAADLGDERDHLVDLEAMGVGPPALRRHLVLRAAALVVTGIVDGVVLGLVLERLVIDLVSLGAGASTAEP